jgi:4-hydroxyacetophenone monooxygenase
MMNIALPPGKHDLASAIAEADIRVLLMVLVHMSGDLRWLEPPYAPRRDVRLIPDPKAGLPENIQDEIRAAALKLLRDGGAKPVITDPGDDLMRKMMNVTLGERVANMRR